MKQGPAMKIKLVKIKSKKTLKEDAIKMIVDFSSTDKDFRSYLRENGNLTSFEGYIDLLKEYLKTGVCSLDNAYTDRYLELLNISTDVLYDIKNGIECNGKVREYDIIDLYKDIDFNPEVVAIFAKVIDEKEALCKYFKFFTWNDYRPVFRCDRDSKIIDGGNTIENMNFELNGHEFTAAEKTEIRDYLRKLKLPINIKVAKVAFERYLAGTLFEVRGPKLIKNR